MIDDFTYIDFDGVILDSIERMLERKENAGFHNHEDEREFYDYFAYTNIHEEEWDYIIRGASPINNSVEIIRELESLKKNIAILTKIHTLNEMKVKIEDLREHRKIYCPVFFVSPGVEKHNVVIPNGQIFVDDLKNNISLWNENGGKGLLFDKTFSDNTDEKVKSLEFLLKR